MNIQRGYLWQKTALTMACLWVAASVTWAAAPLADHVPADAVVYLGWAGADSQAAAYKASDLSAFIDRSNLTDLARQYVPQLWSKLAGQGVDPGTTDTIQKVLPILWRHPVAVYSSNVSIHADGTPQADVALICDAGNDAAELDADLVKLIKTEAHLHVVTRGSLVMLGLDESTQATITKTLIDNASFNSTMRKLQSSAAIAIYVDAKTILQKSNESAASDPQAAEIWPKVRDALGIANVKTYAMTAGFDGSNWMTASLLEAPSPRTGLLAAIEPKPIDPALLARIPASAGSVSVYNFDLAGIYDTIGAALAVTEKSDTTFHQATGLATMALGRPFRKQILGPLGPQWVLYSDANSHSVTLLNHPSDADAANDSLVSAAFGLINLANAQIPGAAAKPVVTANQATVKGIDLTSAVMSLASPTFAAKLGILYFGLTPDSVVNSAILPANPAGGDLLHTPGFLAAQKRLGATEFASFDYCNLPETAPKAYDNFGKSGEQLRQVMDLFGVEVPKVELPPIQELKTHLSPALSVSWSDAEGVYSKSISPFPGSTHLLGDPQQTVISTTTISAVSAIVFPALQRARGSAQMTQSMSQERQILMGIMMYAADHHGEFPQDLGSLITEGQIQLSGGNIFVEPKSKTIIPDEILKGTKQDQAKWVNENAEYVLLTPGRKTSAPGGSDTAVLIPKGSEHATERVPVGFGDGHVEMCKPDRVQHFLHPDAQPAEQ